MRWHDFIMTSLTSFWHYCHHNDMPWRHCDISWQIISHKLLLVIYEVIDHIIMTCHDIKDIKMSHIFIMISLWRHNSKNLKVPILEHLAKRQKQFQMAQDCYVESESDDELEMKELPHKDFKQTTNWGPARKILEKMGWREGEGLGAKKNGVLNPITPDERYSQSKLGLGTPVEGIVIKIFTFSEEVAFFITKKSEWEFKYQLLIKNGLQGQLLLHQNPGHCLHIWTKLATKKVVFFVMIT